MRNDTRGLDEQTELRQGFHKARCDSGLGVGAGCVADPGWVAKERGILG